MDVFKQSGVYKGYLNIPGSLKPGLGHLSSGLGLLRVDVGHLRVCVVGELTA